MDSCPSETMLHIKLRSSMRHGAWYLSFQCLGHWEGDNGLMYVSLLDTQLSQLGEIPRPRYRCGVYHTMYTLGSLTWYSPMTQHVTTIITERRYLYYRDRGHHITRWMNLIVMIYQTKLKHTVDRNSDIRNVMRTRITLMKYKKYNET